MHHLQSNLLVAIDVETTGLDPDVHEIWQLGAMPLNHSLENLGRTFEVMIKPANPELADRAHTHLSEVEFRDKLMRCKVDHEAALDLWWNWIDSLKDAGCLPTGRKIIAIAHNWPFDREFLIAWLGRPAFYDTFHPWYRDTMVVGQFLNDCTHHRWNIPQNTRVPFEQCNLKAMCTKLKVHNAKAHHALSDSAAAAELWRRLVLGKAA